MHSPKANLTTVSRENSVQLGTNCTAKKLRHLSFPFVCCEMAIMIVYDVHICFCMSPLVKGSLVVVLSLVLRVSRFKKRKDQNPFRFLLSYRVRNVGRKGGRGFRRREEGRAIGFPFLSLPPLFAPATQFTSHSFFC